MVKGLEVSTNEMQFSEVSYSDGSESGSGSVRKKTRANGPDSVRLGTSWWDQKYGCYSAVQPYNRRNPMRRSALRGSVSERMRRKSGRREVILTWGTPWDD